MKLKNFNSLPPGSMILITNKVEMYRNIDMDKALAIVQIFFEARKESLTNYYPTNITLEFMELVLQKTFFHFRDTLWIKKERNRNRYTISDFLNIYCDMTSQGTNAHTKANNPTPPSLMPYQLTVWNIYPNK